MVRGSSSVADVAAVTFTSHRGVHQDNGLERCDWTGRQWSYNGYEGKGITQDRSALQSLL